MIRFSGRNVNENLELCSNIRDSLQQENVIFAKESICTKKSRSVFFVHPAKTQKHGIVPNQDIWVSECCMFAMNYL